MEGVNIKGVNESLEVTGNFFSSTLADIYSFFNESKEQFNPEDLGESIDSIIEDLDGLKSAIKNYAQQKGDEQ